MSIDPDYYAVLGVRPDVSPHDLKRQYRRLAKIYHPDRNPGEEEWCTEQLSKVNDAFAVLSDARLREKYDRQRGSTPNETKSTAPHAGAGRSTIVDAPPDPRAYEAYRSADRHSKPSIGKPATGQWLLGSAAVCACLAFAASRFAGSPDAYTAKPTLVHSTNARPVRVAGPAEIEHRHSVARHIEPKNAVYHVGRRRHRQELTSAQKDARALAIAERVEAAKRAAAARNGL